DGVMDKRTIFLDSLVLPRGFCLIENGALIAEPPNLWFVPNINDKAGKKVLVDSAYAKGGNVEHQPNGLLRGLDNWIYNANSPKRYRKQGNKWLVERTHDRGQWGITQDDNGRLFYNNNSQNLLGDYFTPAFGSGNENQRRVAGFNEKVVADNRVYPARANTGVNRGYMKDVLDEKLRLKNFTAASGPLIYRGSLFPAAYYNNAFVPEPSANLIKRDILADSGYRVAGKQAYQGKEFLTSRDERFRPVSLYNGPDGAMYVVDMYRGIIQHKTYLTEYLKNEIHLRELTHPLNCGRIYKIIPTGTSPAIFKMPADAAALPALLKHPDAWVRETAQQTIVDKKLLVLAPALRAMLVDSSSNIGRINALWTLEGIGVLTPAEVIAFLKSTSWPVRRQGLAAVAFELSQKNFKAYLSELNSLLSDNDSLAAPYLAFLSKKISQFSAKDGERFVQTLTTRYPKNNYVTDAVINGLQSREENYYKKLVAANPDTTVQFVRSLKRVIKDIENKKNSSNMKELDKAFPKGAIVFKSICQTCHGPEGNGIRSLAPPLNKSDWVNGNKDRLIPLVLYGLTGPVQVSGIMYQAPEINGDMPGIGNNPDLKDEDVAQILSYIRKAWNNKADSITAKEVAATRVKYAGREKVFTMDELKKIK
ncbi:MAG: c-type cytochrome, partial [Chitinophagaceae bacterium]